MAAEPDGNSKPTLSLDELLELYKTMALIRAFEERFVALVTMGRFVGDSGVSVELIQELLPSDPYIEIVAPKNGSKPDGT